MTAAATSILLVQTAFLGDIVLSTPVIGALIARHPDAKLSVLTTKGGKDLLSNDPRIDEIIVFDKRGQAKGIKGFFQFARYLRSKNFHTVYSLHKSARTALLLYLAGIRTRIGFAHASLSFLYTHRRHRPVEKHDVERNLSIVDNVQDAEKELKLFVKGSSDVLSKHNLLSEGYVVVAPGSVWRTKRWSAKHFQKLVQKLSMKVPVVITGSPAERPLCEYVCQESAAINLAGQLSLADTIDLIASAKAVVCNDSLPLHIASAFKRPLVALFCATSPAFGFGPWRTPFRLLESNELACKPCMRHGSMKCPTGTELCRTAVTPAEVLRALQELAAIKE